MDTLGHKLFLLFAAGAVIMLAAVLWFLLPDLLDRSESPEAFSGTTAAEGGNAEPESPGALEAALPASGQEEVLPEASGTPSKDLPFSRQAVPGKGEHAYGLRVRVVMESGKPLPPGLSMLGLVKAPPFDIRTPKEFDQATAFRGAGAAKKSLAEIESLDEAGIAGYIRSFDRRFGMQEAPVSPDGICLFKGIPRAPLWPFPSHPFLRDRKSVV